MRDGRAAADAIDRTLRGRPLSAVDAHPAEPETRFRIISGRELSADIFSIEVEDLKFARHPAELTTVYERPHGSHIGEPQTR